MTFNLATILRESRSACPGKPLCHSQHTTLTYEQVDEASGRVAAGLLDVGLRPGDRVAVQLPNVPEFLLCYFGILKAGLIMVPLNPLLKGREIAYHLQDSGSRILIGFSMLAAEAMAGAEEAGGTEVYLVGMPGYEPAPDQLLAGTKPFTDLLNAEDTGEIAPTNADDTAVVLYTSGTTGKPKGAELTHFQLYMNCTVAGDLFGIEPDDVSLAVLPLFHVFGLSSVLNVAVRFAGTLALVPRFEVASVLDAIEKHRCTIFSGVPTMYFALLHADTAERDLSALRVGCSGGAPIPGEVIRRLRGEVPRRGDPGGLRAVGVGQHHDLQHQRRAAQGRLHRQADLGRPDPRGRRRRPDAAAGTGARRRDRHPRPQHDEGLLEQPRGHRRGRSATAGSTPATSATPTRTATSTSSTARRTWSSAAGSTSTRARSRRSSTRIRRSPRPRSSVGPTSGWGRRWWRTSRSRPGRKRRSRMSSSSAKSGWRPYKYPREVKFLSALPVGPTGKILKKELRT